MVTRTSSTTSTTTRETTEISTTTGTPNAEAEARAEKTRLGKISLVYGSYVLRGGLILVGIPDKRPI